MIFTSISAQMCECTCLWPEGQMYTWDICFEFSFVLFLLGFYFLFVLFLSFVLSIAWLVIFCLLCCNCPFLWFTGFSAVGFKICFQNKFLIFMMLQDGFVRPILAEIKLSDTKKHSCQLCLTHCWTGQGGGKKTPILFKDSKYKVFIVRCGPGKMACLCSPR